MLALFWLHEAWLAMAQNGWDINLLRAKFFRGNINIYLHFVSFIHIDTTQVVEILPQTRQEPTRASAAMILTKGSRNNSVPAR